MWCQQVRERNKSNMNDAYMKQDLPCVVSLSWTHNHALNTASALLYRPSGLELKEQFFEYFDEGMTAATSIVYHEHALKLLEDFREEDLADGKKNPLQRTVHYWHDEWRKKQRGKLNEVNCKSRIVWHGFK